MYASVSPVRKKISAVMCCRLGGRECVRESVIQGSELVLVSKRVCVCVLVCVGLKHHYLGI